MSSPRSASPLPPTTTTSPTPSPTKKDTTTFPLFRLLPIELRLKVWALTVPEPRLVPLTYLSSTSAITPSTPRSHRGCTSPARIPVALHINSESRSVALQHYTLSFGLSGGPSFRLPDKVFFSEVDVLYFDRKPGLHEGLKNVVNVCLMVNAGETGLGNVKRLAVHRGLFEGDGGKGGVELSLRCFWERVRGRFFGVESVVFVERGSDALLGVGQERGVGGGWLAGTRRELEEKGYGDECRELRCWEEDRFEDKVERVVRSLEEESGWVAPVWKVIPREKDRALVRQRREMLGLEEDLSSDEENGWVAPMQRTEEREIALVKQMRILFGHEDVSNAI